MNNMYGGNNNMMSRSLDKFSIFIGNLHESTTETELRDEFTVHGKICNIHLIRKPSSRQQQQQFRKVFAFIKYENETEAARAIDHEVSVGDK
jgi:RNA recognition motif-containing protein